MAITGYLHDRGEKKNLDSVCTVLIVPCGCFPEEDKDNDLDVVEGA